MSENVLSIKGVNKNFGGLKALDDVNLEIEEAKVHAIIGPNGAGKSTLLNVCIGKLHPDTGSVNFLGENIVGHEPHEINQAGMVRVFQTPEIFPELTLLENVLIPAYAKRDGAFKFSMFQSISDDKEIVAEAEHFLEDMGLIDSKLITAGNLSRGDKRRLEMAMCLVQHPKLLLLDEPTAGMSRHDTNRTIEVMKKIKERGMTKIIIEHDMHVVFSVADTISVLAQGAIIETGTPEEIKNSKIVQEAYLGGAEI